jgi:hypothetical protein
VEPGTVHAGARGGGLAPAVTARLGLEVEGGTHHRWL